MLSRHEAYSLHSNQVNSVRVPAGDSRQLAMEKDNMPGQGENPVAKYEEKSPAERLLGIRSRARPVGRQSRQSQSTCCQSCLCFHRKRRVTN